MKMSRGDLNRRLLFSHCLSEKMSGRNAVVKVADACCGIQSQRFQESLGAFWARMEEFENSQVMSELKPGGGLVRTWAVRNTLHIIPSRDYYVYILGGAGERMLNWIDTIAKNRGYPPREERRRLFHEPVLKMMKGKAVSTEEIRRIVDEKARRIGLREHVWTGIGDMAFAGLIVHGGKRGSQSLWMRSDDWIPTLELGPDLEACRVKLLRKYISRHGPVSRQDIQYWAYLSRRQVDNTLANFQDELVNLKVEGSKEEYVMLGKDVKQEYPPPPKVIILPRFDSLLLSMKDKSRFMDMVYYKRVFSGLAVVEATVLVDGFVAGTWRRVKKKDEMIIEVRVFRRMSRRDRQLVEKKFSEYSEYAGRKESVRWRRPSLSINS